MEAINSLVHYCISVDDLDMMENLKLINNELNKLSMMVAHGSLFPK